MSWADRASFGGLEAVLSLGQGPLSLFQHGIHSYAAAQALNYLSTEGYMVDFGCGNGRFSNYFAYRGYHVLGTEITWEMVIDAKLHSPSEACRFLLTNGISLPVK